MDCISASVITWFLGATFNFNAKVGRPIAIRRLQDFNGVHGFRLHPLHAPCPGVNCLVRTRNVPNTPVRTTVTNMWCLAPSVPTEKETRPTVVMHRHRCTGRNTDFEHAYECVFKNYSVTFGRSLHGVESVGKTGLILSIDSEMHDEEP